MIFGPDGDLYVAHRKGDNVLKFDGGTGASLGVFASGNGPARPAMSQSDLSTSLSIRAFRRKRLPEPPRRACGPPAVRCILVGRSHQVAR